MSYSKVFFKIQHFLYPGLSESSNLTNNNKDKRVFKTINQFLMSLEIKATTLKSLPLVPLPDTLTYIRETEM